MLTITHKMYLLHYHVEGFDSYQIMTLKDAIQKIKQGVEKNSCALNENIYSDEFDSLVLNGVITAAEPEKNGQSIMEYMTQKILKELDDMEIVESGYTVYYEGCEYVALVEMKNNEGTRY